MPNKVKTTEKLQYFLKRLSFILKILNIIIIVFEKQDCYYNQKNIIIALKELAIFDKQMINF
ncbi:hypothetical protein HMPREF1408_00020 [Helicobacter pylori GAM245Ai]|nr:hypothetical protein HMPREF1408_00020 [Helicobacter pylori GAM245Ai]